jgi:Na+/H+ antiporter NhaD/arsenite permease-like protein
MFLANDMALLTFLPLGYISLTATSKEKYMAPIFIIQNIAANLGGMLTPFGNPQNLFLYTRFSIPTGEFMSIMAPPFVVAVILITICCLLIKKEDLEIDDIQIILDPVKTIVYLVLFALSIMIVFRTVPYIIGTVIVTAALFFLDKKSFKDVDWGLLLTFTFFFVFSGNMSRIEAVRNVFSGLLEKSTLLFSAISCQFISNVPSAILLSQFTDNYRELLYGVNIGGTGTLIASLASLITFREYIKHNPKETLKYIGLFTAFNFAFVIILTAFMLLIK